MQESNSVRGGPASFELEELMARCLGKVELLERVVARFQDVFVDDLNALEAALQAADCQEVGRLAHRMKGASANVSAPLLHACTAAIEDVARANQIERIPSMLDDLRREWALFEGEVSNARASS